jgi:5-methylcytosine-specific restriction endonuclease McrA
MILQRDNFTCKKCGRSPAKDQNIILHVDHIVPWSKEGETVVENLETLCKECNLGKSNVL